MTQDLFAGTCFLELIAENLQDVIPHIISKLNVLISVGSFSFSNFASLAYKTPQFCASTSQVGWGRSNSFRRLGKRFKRLRRPVTLSRPSHTFWIHISFYSYFFFFLNSSIRAWNYFSPTASTLFDLRLDFRSSRFHLHIEFTHVQFTNGWKVWER